MRKRIRILVFSVIVAAVIVPLGFAFSLESKPVPLASSTRVEPVSQLAYASAPIVSTRTVVATTTVLPAVPEGAKLFAVGSVLFGLAAAMRRKGSRDA